MSFYGKKYRRAGHENVEELLAASKENEQIAAIIKSKPPTLCFTKVEENVINLHLQYEHKVFSQNFTLGEEKEVEKTDGSKVKITFTQDSENTLDQTVTMPNGRMAFFRREFYEKESKLIVSMPDTSIKATIFFELVE